MLAIVLVDCDYCFLKDYFCNTVVVNFYVLLKYCILEHAYMNVYDRNIGVTMSTAKLHFWIYKNVKLHIKYNCICSLSRIVIRHPKFLVNITRKRSAFLNDL